jgi:hypothetical protein
MLARFAPRSSAHSNLPTLPHCSVVQVQLAKLRDETRCPMCFGAVTIASLQSTAVMTVASLLSKHQPKYLTPAEQLFPVVQADTVCPAVYMCRQDPRRPHLNGVPAPILRPVH